MSTDADKLNQASANIMDIISKQQQMDKVQALMELLKIYDIDITIAGDKQKVLNVELTTEHPNIKFVKELIKNETWRKSVQQVFMLPDLNIEKIVGTMDTQSQLKMVALKRKGAQLFVNGLRNDVAGAEVIPNNTKRKRFFGMM